MLARGLCHKFCCIAASLLSSVHRYISIVATAATAAIIALHDCVTYPTYAVVHLWVSIAAAAIIACITACLPHTGVVHMWVPAIAAAIVALHGYFTYPT